MLSRSLTKAAKRRFVMLRRRRQGSEPRNIRKLISPLRYDVLIRAQFFADLRAGGFENPTPEFHRFALTHSYFTWFKYVECARFFPNALHQPAALMQRYVWRVNRAMSTLQSYDRTGFDLRFPITLGETPSGARADSGMNVSNSLHVRDGCHRLALLLASDSLLEPKMYRVHKMAGTVPDNTALLLPWLNLAEEQYVHFLSPAFVPASYRSLRELRYAVNRQTPDRISEFDQIVRVHEIQRQQSGTHDADEVAAQTDAYEEILRSAPQPMPDTVADGAKRSP